MNLFTNKQLLILSILLVIIACLLLGAHFLRVRQILLTIGCVALPLLLVINARWSLRLVQLVMFLGTGIWLMTALQIYHTRMLFNLPWGRAVGIIVGVAAFTLLTGILLNTAAVKQHYPPHLAG